MSAQVLVAYATRYGSTREVAEAVAAALRDAGLQVDVRAARDVRSVDAYGAVVLGAPLIMLHWHRDARAFLARHRGALARRKLAVFALGPVREPRDEQEWQGSRAQLERDLAVFPWLAPVALQLFGGRFDPAALPWPANRFAGSEPASDARDWTAIRAWAATLTPLIAA